VSHVSSRITHALTRWKILWDHTTLRTDKDILQTVGFMRNARELWFLALVLLYTGVSQGLGRYDVDSMSDPNSYLQSYQANSRLAN
jgi:hypothetical protein